MSTASDKETARLIGIAVTAGVTAALAALDAHHKRPSSAPAVVIDARPNGGQPAEEAPFFTVETFCTAHKISRRLLYKLWKENRGPPITRLGRSVRISKEDAAAWRRQAGEGGE